STVDDCFSFQTPEHSLVELVRNTGADRYSFSAEVCPLDTDANGGEVGIYFGRRHAPLHDVCWSVTLNEIVPDPSAQSGLVTFGLGMVGRQHRGDISREAWAHLPLAPPIRPGQWRPLRVDVTPRYLQISGAGKSFERIQVATLPSRYQRLVEDVAKA